MICRACRDWELAACDAFCPGCGAFAFQVRIEEQVGGDGSRFPVIVLDRPPPRELEGLVLALARGAPTAPHLVSDPLDDLALADFGGDARLPLLDLSGAALDGAVLGLQAVKGSGPDRRLVEPPLTRRSPPAVDASLSLETPDLAADALRPIGPSAGGWLPCRIANRGPAVALSGASLRLDRRRKGAAPLPWPEPRVLLAGETAVVQAFVDPEASAALVALSGEITGSIQLLGPSGEAMGPPHAVRVGRLGPLHARPRVRPHLAALAGRGLRLPIELDNVGGQPFELTSATLVLQEAAEVERFALQPAAMAERVDPGRSGVWELRGEAPPQSGRAVLELTVTGRGGESQVVTAPFQLAVRAADHAYDGRLCIDFGTTASAVAAASGRALRLGDDGALTPPFLVDLARIGLGGPGEGERFLPSQAVRTRSGELAFGAEIEAVPAHDREAAFAGFKWMLADAAGFAVAIAYLRRLKDLIETHPDIAAVIDASTTVFATCPTRFTPALRRRLVEAFVAAGFCDPRTGLFDPRDGAPNVLIAESWAPLPYALFDDPERLRGLGADPAVKRPTLAVKPGQTGRAVILDVGGGSADISVLQLTLSAGRYRIAETRRRTDRAFTGDAFSRLIEASLATLQRQGVLPAGAVDRERLVEAVQFADGAFGGGAMLTLLTAHFARRLAGETGERDEAVVRAALAADMDADDLLAHFERLSPLALGPVGDPSGLVLTEDGLIALCSRILADFTAEHLDHVHALVRGAVGEATGEPLLLIPSGRGVAFPLAQVLVVQAWRLCAGDAPLCILKPLEAKSITSWGGLLLADLAAAGANFDIDLNDGFQVLAVTGRELQTDRLRLQPLSWLAEPDPKAKVTATRLCDIDEGALRTGEIAVRFGDPQGEETDLLGVARLPEEARAAPDGHWLVAEVGRSPAVVRAADAAEAVRRAKRVRR